MANRRMFSKDVTQSARFLRLSIEARALYFEIGMMADDDGICEAFTAMRIFGINQDALDELVDKSFLMMLDAENLVVFITDWRRNNQIRKDRYTPSAYQGLYEEVTGKKIDRPSEDQTVTDGKPDGNQTETQYSTGTGEGRLGSGLGEGEVRSSNSVAPEELSVKQQHHHTDSTEGNTEVSTNIPNDINADNYPENANMMYAETPVNVNNNPCNVTHQQDIRQTLTYAQQCIRGFNDTNKTDVMQFMTKMPGEVIRYAIDEACEQGKCDSWDYAHVILRNLESEDITTLEAAKQRDADFQRQKNRARGNRDRPRAEVKWG